MRRTQTSLERLVQDVARDLAGWPDVVRVFARCLPNTLETTVTRRPDGTTFVITGDIPAMWLRDSTAQVWPYVALSAHDPDLRGMLAGLIRGQARCVLLDPYANAFNAEPRGPGHADLPEPHPLVWERKFELDSLLYPLRLAHGYWRATGDTSPLHGEFREAARLILATLRGEQRHAGGGSPYRFHRPNPVLPTDNLPNGGEGNPIGYTGMVWSAFRPSDDACTYNYHVPGNMMAAVELGHLAEIARRVWEDGELAQEALALGGEIAAGIERFGVVDHPAFGRLYAYETDGLGRHLLMDDANVPSLLSLPYLGYRPAGDPVYANTRRFVLSPANPHFYAGAHASGVGSPHTPPGYVWPIALGMAGLTAPPGPEREEALLTLARTTAGTDLMHESFDPGDPAAFTRPWFGWANSVFAELVLAQVRSAARRP
ncbi:glycoside hydrolase family 125 protein [Deinococcus budaensis]|uniref:Metal-independent alpha-mannosidase n=1 Tax=Deinococcus budaensis TaxID=1665626 RepID=A0A7W8GIK3_9DEIO|nr:glycoside hydrolase family 125 protein [Deinococcus budaensis]MBB5235928.1 hypothetical protein [Deinococcus budaensis]